MEPFERSNQRRHAAESVMPQIENVRCDAHFFPQRREDTTLRRAAHLYERAGFTKDRIARFTCLHLLHEI